MTNQEAFETAVKGILAQGAFATQPGTTACVFYDSTTGNRCALGHLLTEEQAKYAEDSGCAGIQGLHHRGLLLGLDRHFAGALQALHDVSAIEPFDRDVFTAKVHKFALRHNLELNSEFLDA